MNKKLSIGLLLGGGAATVAGVLIGRKRAADVTDAITLAVETKPVPLPLSPSAAMGLPTFNARLTGYWPLVADLSAKERKMEGGSQAAAVWRGRRTIDPNTGKRPIIYTLEQHLSDPVRYPYTSISGDPDVWPFGQRLILSPWPNAIFRVVDTGRNFTDAFVKSKKIYRIAGLEPLDVAVNGPQTVVPKKGVTGKIVPGDSFYKGDVVASGLRGQTLVTGTVLGYTSPVLEARTTADREALARVLASELSGRPREEQVAAGWAVRNRADAENTTIAALLVPHNVYGSPEESGGWASTRKTATGDAQAIADSVLDGTFDPTLGAVDFWVPSQQAKMRQLGDVHRAAKSVGDVEKAKKYARYGSFGTEDEVREQFARRGLVPVSVVGEIELLKRTRRG